MRNSLQMHFTVTISLSSFFNFSRKNLVGYFLFLYWNSPPPPQGTISQSKICYCSNSINFRCLIKIKSHPNCSYSTHFHILCYWQIDFERWKSEDDEEDFSDTNIKNGTAKDILGDYPELFEKLKKDEFGYKKGTVAFCNSSIV